jgi:hypothetical protein
MKNIEMIKNIRQGRAMSIKPLIVATIAASLFAFVGSAYAEAPGPAPVDLQSAGNFVILTKTGITDVPTSAVTGNIGTSPITGAADLVTCTEVTGSVYSDDAAGPSPCSVASPSTLTAAVLDMQAAYTDAAGRSKPDFTELGAGNIGGMTLIPGLYKWGTGVKIPTDVTGGQSQREQRCQNSLSRRRTGQERILAGRRTGHLWNHLTRRGNHSIEDHDRHADWRIRERQAVRTDCGYVADECRYAASIATRLLRPDHLFPANKLMANGSGVGTASPSVPSLVMCAVESVEFFEAHAFTGFTVRRKSSRRSNSASVMGCRRRQVRAGDGVTTLGHGR